MKLLDVYAGPEANPEAEGTDVPPWWRPNLSGSQQMPIIADKEIAAAAALRLHMKYSDDQPRDEHGRWTDGGGTGGSTGASRTATPESSAMAQSMVAAAREAEPKVTADIQGLTDKLGLPDPDIEKFRIKSEDSLAGKLSERAASRYGGDLNRASDGIKDSLRYTVVGDPHELAGKAQGVISGLQQAGYRPIAAIDNSFGDHPPYKGVTTQWQSPGGQKFELQFHTPQSLDVKESGLHPIYNEARTIDVSTPEGQQRYDQLDRQMRSISNGVEDPPGISQLHY